MLRLFLFGWMSFLAGCNLHEPVGVVLVYEVDKDRDPEAAKVSTDRVLSAVQRRLRGGGEAKAAADGRIEVRIYGKDATAVRSRLQHAGSLEFRIVADRRDDRHRDVIALAEEQDANRREKGVEESGAAESNTVLDEGLAAAKWVKVVDAEAKFVANSPEFVLRHDAEGRTEVLVMLDPYNVTGDYFTSVSASG